MGNVMQNELMELLPSKRRLSSNEYGTVTVFKKDSNSKWYGSLSNMRRDQGGQSSARSAIQQVFNLHVCKSVKGSVIMVDAVLKSKTELKPLGDGENQQVWSVQCDECVPITC